MSIQRKQLPDSKIEYLSRCDKNGLGLNAEHNITLLIPKLRVKKSKPIIRFEWRYFNSIIYEGYHI